MSRFLSSRSLALVGLLSLFAACSPILQPSVSNQLTASSTLTSTIKPAAPTVLTLRNENLFPTKRGYRWEYNVTSRPNTDPLAIEKSNYSLEIEKVETTTAGTKLGLRTLSGTSDSLSSLVINKESIQLQDATFLGFGSESVLGLNLSFLKQPLQTDLKWEDANWLGKVKGIESVTVPAGSFQTWRIEVIGNYGQAYTAVGHYWIAPGVGIVKALYSLPNSKVEMVLNKSGLRQSL
jgi:hypothetical protein